MKKALFSLMACVAILAPVAAQAANDPIEPLAVHQTVSADFKPISPFVAVAPAVNDPIEPLTIFPPTE